MPINADGSLGAVSTSYFNTPRSLHSMTAANGHLYIAGGIQSASDTACKNTGASINICNDIQRMAINADGSLGAISTSYFNTPRSASTMTALNGYLYISGGNQNSTNTACVNTGVANQRCNDIQRMAINADGSLGDIFTSYFVTPRHRHAMTAANGHLYIAGGQQANSDTACVNTGTATDRCNDIQRMAIAPDGSLGAISTSYFNTPRSDHAMTAANGYLYISGGRQSAADTGCKDTGFSNDSCNDIQRMAINADGSLGSISTSYMSTRRTQHAMIAYSGNLYNSGGSQNTSNTNCKNTGTSSVYCNDIQRMQIAQNMLPSATYEKMLDTRVKSTFQTVTVNGSIPCGAALIYKTAGLDGVFGASTSVSDVKAGQAVTINQIDKRYLWIKLTLNDSSSCAANASITDITLAYLAPPTAPALISPANGSHPSITPQFHLRATDDPGYARYKIEVCSNADCSTIIRTIDQTTSQTGWTGQDAQSGTAYAIDLDINASTIAKHDYQGPALAKATQYWWRAAAIDPADTNTFGPYSTIASFITQAAPSAPELIKPTSGTIGVVNTTFTLRAADVNSDYLRYRIQLCSDSTCNTVIQTFDQSVSQAGWSGQNAASGTAYASNPSASSSTTATYTLSSNLKVNTTYWWRAYAIDPAGENVSSPASVIASFNTGPSETLVEGRVDVEGRIDFGS